MEPFVVLPLQVWERILSYLSNPLDKLNLIRVNVELEKVFEDKKAEWQFTSILPLMIKHFEKKTTAGLQDAILSCRLVSWACCTAVDDYIKAFYDKDGYGFPFIPLKNFHYSYFENLQKIIKFFDKIKDHPVYERTTVVRRDMHLNFYGGGNGENEGRRNFANEPIIGVMEKIGHNLFSVSLWNVNFLNGGALVEFLQRILRDLPNLRTLKYVQCGVPIGDPQELLPDPEPFVAPNLPHLKHLIFLNITNQQTLPGYICFRSYFPQLTYLDIEFDLWREGYGAQGLFQNLKFLRINNIPILPNNTGNVQERLIEITEKLDTPQLQRLNFLMNLGMEYTKAFEKIKFVQTMALYFLKKRYPDKTWESLQAEYVMINWINGSYQTTSYNPRRETLDLYNSMLEKRPKIYQIKPPPQPQPQSSCSIV